MNKKMLALGLGFSLAASSAMALDWFNLPLIGGNDKVSVTTTTNDGGSSEVSAARVRVLNKDSNRLNDVTLTAGQQTTGGPLQFSMKRCVRDLQGVPGQDAAWIEVRDSTNASLFEGWMFNLYPDVAAVENARYDVRLLGCLRSALPKPAAVRKAPADTGSGYAPGGDAEAPQDGSDPNYVEGVEKPAEAPKAPEEFPTSAPDGATDVKPADPEPQAGPAPDSEAPAAPVASGTAQDELHQLMDAQ